MKATGKCSFACLALDTPLGNGTYLRYTLPLWVDVTWVGPWPRHGQLKYNDFSTPSSLVSQGLTCASTGPHSRTFLWFPTVRTQDGEEDPTRAGTEPDCQSKGCKMGRSLQQQQEQNQNVNQMDARWRGGSSKSRNRTRMSIKGQSRTGQGKSENARVGEIQRKEWVSWTPICHVPWPTYLWDSQVYQEINFLCGLKSNLSWVSVTCFYKSQLTPRRQENMIYWLLRQ